MIIDFKESAGNPEGVTLFDSPKFLDTLQKRRKILPNVQTTLYTQPSPTTVRGGRWLFFLQSIESQLAALFFYPVPVWREIKLKEENANGNKE